MNQAAEAMQGKSGLLKRLYLILILALIYVPILLVIIYSFNENRLSSVWSGFSLQWYRILFKDKMMFEALRNSLFLALTSSLFAALIGTTGAISMARIKPVPGKIAHTIEFFSILPIMIPEIIMGITLLIFFNLFHIPMGMVTLIIAHTCFCVPYVYLIVKARLAGLDKSLMEAARNLGAGEWQVIKDITLPLVFPAVLSGILLSFAMSFDDVIVSVFVTGHQTNTLPIKIYSQVKGGVTPKTNALCTILFAITVLLCILAAVVFQIKPEVKSDKKNLKNQKKLKE